MILNLGMSPAWQQILHMNCFREGEVNRARESIWCASGKVLNVARALKCLSVEAMKILRSISTPVVHAGDGGYFSVSAVMPCQLSGGGDLRNSWQRARKIRRIGSCGRYSWAYLKYWAAFSKSFLRKSPFLIFSI